MVVGLDYFYALLFLGGVFAERDFLFGDDNVACSFSAFLTRLLLLLRGSMVRCCAIICTLLLFFDLTSNSVGLWHL